MELKTLLVIILFLVVIILFLFIERNTTLGRFDFESYKVTREFEVKIYIISNILLYILYILLYILYNNGS